MVKECQLLEILWNLLAYFVALLSLRIIIREFHAVFCAAEIHEE